jgi:hypothetical protein
VKPARIVRVSRKPVSGFGALALAFAVLLAHLGGTWHFATRQHVRCAEHGEWTDVAAHDPPIQSAPRSQGPIVEARASSLAGDDHCVFFLASRLREIIWQAATSVSQPSPIVAKAWTPIADPVESGFAIYLLAPKQSPPC